MDAARQGRDSMSTRPVSWVKLEEDAYYAVLRALAVNELNWVSPLCLSILEHSS